MYGTRWPDRLKNPKPVSRSWRPIKSRQSAKNEMRTLSGLLSIRFGPTSLRLRSRRHTVLTTPGHSAEFRFQTGFGKGAVHSFNALVDQGLVVSHAGKTLLACVL